MFSIGLKDFNTVEIALTKGEYLFRKGDPAERVIYISEGSVSLHYEEPLLADLTILETKKIWGVKEILLGTSFKHSCKASESFNAFAIHKDEFLYVLNNKPSLRLELMNSLAQELKEIATNFE